MSRLRVLSTITIITSLCIIGAAGVVSGENQNQICNGDPEGNSTIDRNGCLDSDGDGYSDYSENWTKLDGADAFPFDEYAWSDMDNDGFTDQRGTDYSDDCPFTWGKSRVILRGCSDIDRDFVPDSYDDDADGDGIRNEMERAASTGTQLFDPYDPDSTPSDVDLDTIPDVLDDDNDNDNWPDDVEIDRGSDPFDEKSNPFNMYLGFGTGLFYMGGLQFTTDYEPSGFEISLSVLIDVATEEMMIPFLLIPAYVVLSIIRRRQFHVFEERIKNAENLDELRQLESKINRLIRSRGMRLYHGLVLRNTIEEFEDNFSYKKSYDFENEPNNMTSNKDSEEE